MLADRQPLAAKRWHWNDVIFPIMQHSDCNSLSADMLNPFNNTSMSACKIKSTSNTFWTNKLIVFSPVLETDDGTEILLDEAMTELDEEMDQLFSFINLLHTRLCYVSRFRFYAFGYIRITATILATVNKTI